jgi:creatinine amidohydrolase
MLNGMPARTIAFLLAASATIITAQSKGILLEDLTWVEAEKVLTPDTIVVIPVGAESKEHGPHLKLKNDWLIAEYLKHEVLTRTNVVIAPTVNYHYYPAFVEYPGSTTLRLETARDMMVDIVHSLARYGPRRFYALNTGVSTMRALRLSGEALAADGIEFRFTDILKVAEATEKQIKEEEGGTHAEEIETSLMLFIAPSSVEMKKAVKDYHPGKGGGLSRDSNGKGDYSASGIFGDATLATRKKGETMVHAIVDGVLKEIEDLRKTPVR